MVSELLLPNTVYCWTEVRRILSRKVIRNEDLLEVVSELGHAHCLVAFAGNRNGFPEQIGPLLHFIGFGNFIRLCLSSSERKEFNLNLFPFIVQCAINVENTTNFPLAFSFQHQEYDRSLPFGSIVPIVACSFLCLLPQQPSRLLFSRADFRRVFVNVVDENSAEPQHLRRILSYFNYCRSPAANADANCSLRIIRRQLDFGLPPNIRYNSDHTKPPQLSYEAFKLIIPALKSINLPLLLVDQCRSAEFVADHLQVPMVYCVNGHIGDDVLRFIHLQKDPLFMRYPDLLISLVLCQRLDDFESLWIDHFRGPFESTRVGATSCSIDNAVNLKLRWRRLITMNSMYFPRWASETQYTPASILMSVMNATVAFFGANANKLPTKAALLTPFSSQWWSYLLSKLPPESSCDGICALQQSCTQSLAPCNISALAEFADRLSVSILRTAPHAVLVVRSSENLANCIDPPRTMNPANPESDTCISNQDSNIAVAREPTHIMEQESTPEAVVPLQTSQDPSAPLETEVWNSRRCSPSQSCNSMFESASVSLGHYSSTRSSFSQGHSLSTQSSLRRQSDLSSSDGSGWPSTRPRDSLAPELHDLAESEAEVDNIVSGDQLSRCHDTKDIVHGHHMPSSVSPSSPNPLLQSLSSSSGGCPTISEAFKSLVICNFANHWSFKLLHQSISVAVDRANRVYRYADQLSQQAVLSAVRELRSFDHWAQIHNGLPSISRSVRKSLPDPDNTSALMRRLVTRSLSRPSAKCRSGRIPSFEPNLTNHLRRFFTSNSSSTSLSFSPQPDGQGASTCMSNPCCLFARKQSYKSRSRWCRNHISRESFPHTQISSLQPADSSKFFPRSFRVGHKAATILQPASTVDHCITSSLSAPFSFRQSSPTKLTPVRSTDTLHRYAESLASLCCASALQTVKLQASPTSGQRPPGVVTTGLGGQIANSASDPQLKVITQWIAATLAGSVVRTAQSNEQPVQNMTDGSNDVGLSASSVPPPSDAISLTLPEYYVSPIIVCTSGDPELVQLPTLVHRVNVTGCTTGLLLSLLLDYSDYRAALTGCSSSSNPATVMSLFKYLLTRLPQPPSS